MSEKFGDENPQTAGFQLSASQINMEQVKHEFDERYALVEALAKQAQRIDDLSKELDKYKYLNNLQHLWWAAWIVGLIIWQLLQ